MQTSAAPVVKTDPYEAWQQQEGVPVYKGCYIQDLYTLELGPWERKGGHGAYVNLADQYEDDSYVVEIPPGGQLNPEHHMYEALIQEGAPPRGRGARDHHRRPGLLAALVRW